MLCLICGQLEGQVTAMLVQNMERLDETVKEEADGVHNTLGICFTLKHHLFHSQLFHF